MTDYLLSSVLTSDNSDTAASLVHRHPQSFNDLVYKPDEGNELYKSGTDGDDHIVCASDYAECTIIFGVLGCCSAFFWEALLNELPTISLQLYPEQASVSDRITGVFNTAIFIAAIIMTFISPLNKFVINAGAASLAVTSVLVGLISQYWSHSTGGAIALGASCFVAGLASGFTESATFAYAICLNRTHLVGCFSFGFGISGIISFVFWLLWTKIMFSGLDEVSSVKSVWAQQILSTVIAVASIFAFWRLTLLKSYKLWKLKNNDECAELSHSLLSLPSKAGPVAENDSDEWLSLYQVVKATASCQFHVGLCLFISYAVRILQRQLMHSI